jgi:alpha-D-xyloside xylohydrolase
MNYFTGETFEGPGWRTEQHDYMSLPLWVRPNAVIPLGSQDDRPDYDYAEQVTLRVYSLSERTQKTISIPNQSGEVASKFEVAYQDGKFSITPNGDRKPWQVELVGIHAVAVVEGGSFTETSSGTQVLPDSPGTNLVITL